MQENGVPCRVVHFGKILLSYKVRICNKIACFYIALICNKRKCIYIYLFIYLFIFIKIDTHYNSK